MDTYRSKVYAASLVPVKIGTKIKTLIEGTGTGLYQTVVEIKNDYDGKGLNVAVLSDETTVVIPADANGEFHIKYYGTSTKRRYYCRTEPTWTAEQRQEVETIVYDKLHPTKKGLLDGEKAYQTYCPSKETFVLKPLRTVSNADLYDQLPMFSKYYPEP